MFVSSTKLFRKLPKQITVRNISTRGVSDDSKLIEQWKSQVSSVLETNSEVINVGPLIGLSVVLASPGETVKTNWKDGDKVPSGWHLVYFNNYQIPEENLSSDGYEATFSAPPPFLHRMWASSTLTFETKNPLLVGQHASVKTRCSSVDYKRSASRGDIVFVELERKVNNKEGVCLTETRKLAYFKQKGDPSKATKLPVPEKSEFQRVISPTEVKLFRYSALTYNCHRIHYDHNYATKVEGYPSILVHGPLTATFLIDLAARQFPKNPIKSFTYKATSPLFAGEPFTIHGNQESDGKVNVWAKSPEGNLAMTGVVELSN